jgi:hypothetical protein
MVAPLELKRYFEPLEKSELEFLEKKESTERSQYYKVYRLLMFLSFIIPFAGAWYRAADGMPDAFSKTKFFFTAGLLLSISSFATYITYRVNLRKIQMDIKDKTKTIEISHVNRKLYLDIKDAYYLYIDSKVKLSIEVSPNDYNEMDEGDEVCIEYATHSKQYLGYF